MIFFQFILYNLIFNSANIYLLMNSNSYVFDYILASTIYNIIINPFIFYINTKTNYLNLIILKFNVFFTFCLTIFGILVMYFNVYDFYFVDIFKDNNVLFILINVINQFVLTFIYSIILYYSIKYGKSKIIKIKMSNDDWKYLSQEGSPLIV